MGEHFDFAVIICVNFILLVRQVVQIANNEPGRKQLSFFLMSVFRCKRQNKVVCKEKKTRKGYATMETYCYADQMCSDLFNCSLSYKGRRTNYLYPHSDFSVALFGENKRIVHFAFVMHKLFHTTTQFSVFLGSDQFSVFVPQDLYIFAVIT